VSALRLTLHIFQKNADRVQMANIAQLVNVLQAMILTDGPRMVRTPTYWVFEMLKGHQGGEVVPIEFEVPVTEVEGIEFHAVTVAATGKDGATLVSLANLDPHNDREVTLDLPGQVTEARVLTGPSMVAHNTFDAPDTVTPVPLSVTATDAGMRLVLPRHSVATVRA
jgi:alpha-N-arabinofuranosidase